MAERILITDKGKKIVVNEITELIEASTGRRIPIDPPVVSHIDAVKAADSFLKKEQEEKKEKGGE